MNGFMILPGYKHVKKPEIHLLILKINTHEAICQSQFETGAALFFLDFPA